MDDFSPGSGPASPPIGTSQGEVLSQLDKMRFALNLLNMDYPNSNPSEAGIDQESLGMAAELDIEKDEAKEYINRAIADRNMGVALDSQSC